MNALLEIVEGATYGLAVLVAIIMIYIIALTMVNHILDYRYSWAWIEMVLTLVLTGWMAYITFSKSSTVSTIINSEYADNPEIRDALSYLSGIPYEVILLFLTCWLIMDWGWRKKPEIARWFVPFKLLLALFIIGTYVV